MVGVAVQGYGDDTALRLFWKAGGEGEHGVDTAEHDAAESAMWTEVHGGYTAGVQWPWGVSWRRGLLVVRSLSARAVVYTAESSGRRGGWCRRAVFRYGRCCTWWRGSRV